jgi:iron complex transport system ATP-binding protein
MMTQLAFPESVGPEQASNLACQDVWFGYKHETEPVLKGVSLTLQEGSLVGVIGPNGSGKSTLMRVLSGVIRSTRGTVTLDGSTLQSLGKKALAKRVAVLAQEEAPEFAFTVREVVAMGRAPHHGGLYFEDRSDTIAIERSMERAGVAHLADRSVEALSGGERQRVRIARALAQEPRFLLLDEPTNHLDLYSQLSVTELLRDIHREGLAILIVSHDINLVAELCQRVHLMRNGSFLYAGTPHDVVTEESIARCFSIRAVVEVNAFTGAPRITPLGKLGSG